MINGIDTLSGFPFLKFKSGHLREKNRVGEVPDQKVCDHEANPANASNWKTSGADSQAASTAKIGLR
jgi:hypothetical protein